MKPLCTLFLWLFCLVAAFGEDFPYRSLPPFVVAPSENANCMMFDRDGLMWLGTNVGLKSYDGYTVKTFRSDAYFPDILPNNTIRSIAEDRDGNLWLGTRNGLVRMNRRTGVFRTFHLPAESQRVVYTLYVSKDGTLWVGTDGGLSVFNPQDETFHTYDGSNTWLVEANGERQKMPEYSVKAILEDRNGELLIGTWSAGLLRFRRGSHEMHRYPRLNAMNSAYSLFFDRKHRLWVGTWGYGVLRIDNPDDIRHPAVRHYPYTITHFDTYYKIVEDPVSRKLWACTREGVCCIDWEDDSAEWQHYAYVGETKLTFNNDIATDGQGNIWLCTQNDGIVQVTTTPSPFHNWNLNRHSNLTIHCLYSMFTADGEWFWLGLTPYGLALYNRRTHTTYYNKGIPGFAALNDRILTTSISAIVQRCNGELWFAVNNYGVIVKPPVGNARNLNRKNTRFIREDFVNTLFESRDGVMWIGARSGMGLAFPDNTGTTLTMKEGNADFSICDIRHITQDRNGTVWVATDNKGIIRITGNPRNAKTLKYKQYSPDRDNFAINDATACLEDSQGRLWAISSSSGLFLYNRETDRFEPKNRDFHLPAVRALAMMEDHDGHLWLTTERALVRLVMGKDNRPENVTNFTKEDGIGDQRFAANSCCKYGNELFFGNGVSFCSFVPGQDDKAGKGWGKKLVVTDLLIDDQSFVMLDSAERQRISQEMPGYTRHLELPAHVKKLTVEFALLTYGNAAKNIYAYRLDGYDNDWQYILPEDHRATFQNLPSGTYHLHLKATDSYGLWQELPYVLTIRVLPPWYASNIALVLYALLLIAAVFSCARWYREHLRTKNRLQMGVILANITHELLTPLSVISATIYKLKGQAPQYEDDYEVMDSNISRTTRLLRQMLEVRKSQAGQLRLLVSKGDLATFVRNACESIRPMATQRKVSLELSVPESGGKTAWFDADKMDKILYNLLSNAIKYNREEGRVAVTLSLSKDEATITIRDTGIGMSKDKLKHLYTRFFDGDYRKQNMPGTGIGLSLTRDLVRLHHGSIQCESVEDEGTAFTVTFPIRKRAYTPDETDCPEQAVQETVDNASAAVHRQPFIRRNANKILVVEDNVELLTLMQQVLGKTYHVLTARNGKQAVGIIRKENLDLVVSDVMMPVMDGIELVRYLKADKSFWQLPVILLTAKNKEEDQTEAYSAGADAYITKPFRFEDLEVRIDALLVNRKRLIEKIETDHALTASAAEEAKQEEAHLSNPDQAFVTRATETVLRHLADPDYDRQAFANDMTMGESSLYNKVKATTGQTVVAFVTTIRLREAQRIMRQEPDILISELAARVGFNTPKYFSKCFRKEFGVYPKEYAEELKKSKI